MKISNDTTPAFGGKFIINENVSLKNKKMLNQFFNYKLKGKLNKRLLLFKPYNVSIKQIEADKLEFNSSFKLPYTNKTIDCFISTFYTEKEYIESATMALRGSLNWFEDYKKKNNGYNNFIEKIMSNIRDIL